MHEQEADSLKSRNARHFSPLLRLALVLGILVHVIGFLAFKIASNSLPSPEEKLAFISLFTSGVEEDASEFAEQASLFDSAPLFMPGEWSSAAQVFSHRSDQERRIFPELELGIPIIDEIRPQSWTLSSVGDVRQPSDFLALHFWDLFSYFGGGETREQAAGEAHASHGGSMQVRVLSGNEVYPSDYSIRMDLDFQTEAFAAQPIVFAANLFAPGMLAGAPLLKQSSGSDSLDAEVLEWLVRPSTLARLPAGLLELRFYL